MEKDYPGERWKEVKIDLDYTNDFKLEISNFGRLKTFNKISQGKILKGSMINGYRIIRLKLYSPRPEKDQKKFNFLQQQVSKLSEKIKSQKKNKSNGATIKESQDLLAHLKKSLSKKFQDDLKARTIHYHALVHRLVAEYFLPKPRSGQTIVAHLDHDKLNNRFENLKWMKPEENYAHQQKSPHVIKEKLDRKSRRKENSKATKLTVTKVMLLKKLLNEGKSIKQLVKHFKITDTQILRIKRGENWAEIPAAE